MLRSNKLSEAKFTRQVIQFAQANGWRVLHIRPARRKDGRYVTPVQGDGVGFPDLLMIRDRIVIAELKVGRNRKTPAQQQWLQAFVQAGVTDTFTWYPSEWDEIEKELGR